MRTNVIVLFFLLVSGIMSAQVKRVAILETVDSENKISSAYKLMLRASLNKAITQTTDYDVYDRTDVDTILNLNFQRTGVVSTSQIKRIGELASANYILLTEAAVLDSKKMFITAKLLEVETASTIMVENMVTKMNVVSVENACVSLVEKFFLNPTMSTSDVYLPSTTKVSPNSALSLVSEYDSTLINPFLQDMPKDSLVVYSKAVQKSLGLKKYSYGETQMDEKAYIEFLQQNHAEAYLQYLKNQKMKVAGWSLFGVGLGIGFTGAMCHLDYKGYMCPFHKYHHTFDWGPGDTAGIFLWPIGAAMTITSIPLLCLAYSPQNDPVAIFNNSHSNSPITLTIQTSSAGIGLALSF